jgi:hypothetical protein
MKSNNYTRLVWKQQADGKTALKIGFGVEGSWVVAWICGLPAEDTITPAITKANVPAVSCTKTVTGANAGTYDKCFNDAMILNLNVKRREHVVDDLAVKEDHAVILAKKVKASGVKWNDANTKPSDVLKPTGLYVDYWYYNADTAKLFSSDAAAKSWYAGNTQYD